ncbi:MAG TPA: hypothetical protein ENI12_00075 [Nitrospirae bacterium]|nr:hypothetical protein [Nitrospirota bacterium]
MSDQQQYRREDLEKIFTACIAMSTLDGEIHLDEIKPVVSFIEGRWQSGYGDINKLSEEANESALEILKSHSLYKSLGGIAESLSGSLDQGQKDAVLKLLSTVLHADGEGHEMEHGMYDIFTRKFEA